MRTTYLDRLAAHREAVRAAARAVGWTTMLHRTDASAAQALLTLSFGLAPGAFNGAA